MADGVENLPERVQAVEQKLDALSVSVDMRFDGVDAAIAEQRQYTEFAFDRLANEMRTGFSNVDGRFNNLEDRFDKLEGGFDKLDGRSNRLERTLDQFIDTQSKANELVERRLRVLEPPTLQE